MDNGTISPIWKDSFNIDPITKIEWIEVCNYPNSVRIPDMKITIIIQDTDNDSIKVTEERDPGDGENENSITSASALADAMFELMDQLGEAE